MTVVVTRVELLEGWSAGEIVTVAPELLVGLDVPRTARHFLTGVGLPRAFPFYFTTVADRYQDVAEGESLIGPYRWRELELLRLGSSYRGYLCLDAANGHVTEVSPNPSDEREPDFVNSSVEAFAAFLLRVRLRQLAGGLDDVSDDELELRADVFFDALRQLDPAALADEERYWSVIVEQMGYGHL